MSTNVLEEIFAGKLEQRFMQGREEGERSLPQRFGPIPSALEERIATLDAEGLAALFDRALTASTIEAL